MKTTPSKTTSAVDDDREEKSAADESAVADLTKTEPDAAAAPDNTPDAASDDAVGHADAEDDDDLETDPYAEAEAAASAGAGGGAAAVVAAALGVISLSGSWTGRVAAERETLIGQIKTSGGGSAAQQISEIYADGWHTTALVGGLFALLALLVGAFVLVRPAFGPPAADPQPGWIRSVALAGVALGVLGILISVGMYFDLVVGLPVAAG
ncbi:hypothetical protein OG596_11150 [Streptomyces sp. NBC_01102]|uniref:hypothetical protein n=1 Tax=unclassified Streptomyces TaxID=2593676 RepID=UPI00386F2F46|nr:hypothetical protein OG596_11150 [Streptomyces sp. NBC_01102]